jgi:hypothetical protein
MTLDPKQTEVPLIEEVLAENVDLVDAIMSAKMGEVMTPEEFKAWLEQQ